MRVGMHTLGGVESAQRVRGSLAALGLGQRDSPAVRSTLTATGVCFQ